MSKVSQHTQPQVVKTAYSNELVAQFLAKLHMCEHADVHIHIYNADILDMFNLRLSRQPTLMNWLHSVWQSYTCVNMQTQTYTYTYTTQTFLTRLQAKLDVLRHGAVFSRWCRGTGSKQHRPRDITTRLGPCLDMQS